MPCWLGFFWLSCLLSRGSAAGSRHSLAAQMATNALPLRFTDSRQNRKHVLLLVILFLLSSIFSSSAPSFSSSSVHPPPPPHELCCSISTTYTVLFFEPLISPNTPPPPKLPRHHIPPCLSYLSSTSRSSTTRRPSPKSTAWRSLSSALSSCRRVSFHLNPHNFQQIVQFSLLIPRACHRSRVEDHLRWFRDLVSSPVSSIN